MEPGVVGDARKLIAREMLDVTTEKLDFLSSYFELYDSLTRPRPQHTIIQLHDPILRSHHDIQRLARELKAYPHLTRDEFKNRIRSLTQPTPPGDSDIEYAINIIIHLMLMIDCTIVDNHSHGYEVNGYRPTKWKAHEKLSEFVSHSFSLDDETNRMRIREAHRNCNLLKGWKLKKRAHVTFQPTDDLREHLLIFRHTAFLKAHLRKSENVSLDCGIVECLQMGTLPPRLLLETLHSLQFVLFPSFDEKSFNLLDKLVHDNRSGLDPDSLAYDGLIRELPADFEYHYWGSRLVKLHNLVMNPKPKHRLGQWVQRHTSERNALYVALAGLFLSVLFGFLGVIIGIIQTWISYQAWKHPRAS
ncbi:hypothetical protein F5884DRAFT_880221 [Xylogone sp. PMI_703]|nr:hypothetical protein F5884DRAFT_880221 [Xylogone sp. PMI_703]